MSLVLGLDVSSKAVRGAFLRTALRGSEMERYAEAALPAASDPERQTQLLQAAIQELIAQSPRPPDRIIAALDGEAASLRVIELPAGVVKKVAEVLPGELESLLPFPIETSVVDYQVVDRDKETIRVMAVAVPREKIAARLAQLSAAGVDPRELAVGAATFDGLCPLLPEAYSMEVVALVDLGATSTDFCVLAHGRCVFARTLSGGMDLVESGRRAQLGAALQRTLAGYRAQRETPPDRVLLSGEASPIDGARQWLADQLGLPVEVVPLPKAAGADHNTLPRFARAAALAGRTDAHGKQLDLRQGEFASRAAAGQLRTHLRLAAVCALAIAISFGVSLFTRFQVARSDNQQLADKLASVSSDLLGTETRSPVHARELLTGGGRPNDPLPRFDAYDILEALSEGIPTDIKHETRRLLIELDDEGAAGRFEIQGTLDSIAERDRIVDELTSHRCFTEVEKGSISTAAEERKNYKLEVKVACPESQTKVKKEKSRGTR